MSSGKSVKRKIINDPVYGFVGINNEQLFNIIEHPWFQRLRRIKQLGLTHLVYPGALHTRFHHSVGAMFLMQKALNELRFKGVEISTDEYQAACVAILLHDIGHGPYSHALEHSIVSGITHEDISNIFLDRFNSKFDNKFNLAIDIFSNNYKRKFFHEMVSSQFDMDRLDYLKRDSFFSGVSEGVINYERLLNMIDVVDDQLVIEEKGIYSVEKFITARRLMYWQVYLHKTVLSAEIMLMKVLKRAKYLSLNGMKLFASPALEYFLKNDIGQNEFETDENTLEQFALLDDFDIFSAMKVWTQSEDYILSTLCDGLVNRKLFKIKMQNEKFGNEHVNNMKNNLMAKMNLSEEDIGYFFVFDKTSNYIYNPGNEKINILFKSGEIVDIATASDQLNINLLSKPTIKYFVCHPA